MQELLLSLTFCFDLSPLNEGPATLNNFHFFFDILIIFGRVMVYIKSRWCVVTCKNVCCPLFIVLMDIISTWLSVCNAYH